MSPNADFYIASTPAELGQLVRRQRKLLDLRQEDLALAAGCARSFIIDLEAGKETAQIAPILRVVNALGLQTIFQSKDLNG
jgi:y4mF family transcriptional regulator